MDFFETWNRVKSETDIKKFVQLAEFVGISQQFVSKKKRENDFPVDWAFKIARKYNLFTDWVLTGEGPRRLSDISISNRYPSVIECDLDSQKDRKISSDLIKDLDTWVSEMLADEPGRADWIKYCIYDALPTFKEWRKRKESGVIDEVDYP